MIKKRAIKEANDKEPLRPKNERNRKDAIKKRHIAYKVDM
jgi:hypothetical protein